MKYKNMITGEIIEAFGAQDTTTGETSYMIKQDDGGFIEVEKNNFILIYIPLTEYISETEGSLGLICDMQLKDYAEIKKLKEENENLKCKLEKHKTRFSDNHKLREKIDELEASNKQLKECLGDNQKHNDMLVQANKTISRQYFSKVDQIEDLKEALSITKKNRDSYKIKFHTFAKHYNKIINDHISEASLASFIAIINDD